MSSLAYCFLGKWWQVLLTDSQMGLWSKNTVKSASQSVIPEPAASAFPGNLLGMHIPRPHPRPTEPETLRVGLRNLLVSLPRAF